MVLSIEYLMLEVVAVTKAYFGKASHVLPDFTSSSTSISCEVGKPPLLKLHIAAAFFILWLYQQILVIVSLHLLVLYAVHV